MLKRIHSAVTAFAQCMHCSATRIDGKNRRHQCARQSPAVLSAVLCFTIVFASAVAWAKPLPPNILFIIMDDVGMDQMSLFGYGGDIAADGRVPQLPNIGSIAAQGVAFRNTWSMPACSTSRAVFFTGRYPLRTHVLGALGENDLANAMVSPYEITLPVLLQPAGYQSALFGKFHLGLQGNNPFGNAMTQALGWDYFYGWLDATGDPSSIDTWAGLRDAQPAGTTDPGPYPCGFVPAFDPLTGVGADFGACYTAQGKCRNLKISDAGVPPGRACRDSGGILAPQAFCEKKLPGDIESGFSYLSGHYVSPLFIVRKNATPKRVDTTDVRARTFRGTAVVDGAIEWINKQPKNKPWMASVSFASAHTPAMQPPQELINTDPVVTSALDCTPRGNDPAIVDENQRELTTQMIEALDTELARLLVSIGVARPDGNGKTLNYSAADNQDTMIIILGDNGTLANVVNTPFDPKRAKGTAYQTGVWVPLIIAGPLVDGVNRTVRSMVNIADLYYLFGEIAGIDVDNSVPRNLDAKPMLAYLTSSKQDDDPIRTYNFTQVGPNVQAGFALNQPCQIGNACTQIPVSASVCSDNGGVWWGKDSTVIDTPLDYCCQVNQYLYEQAVAAIQNCVEDCECDPTAEQDPCNPVYLTQQPLESKAIRNADYKIVRNTFIGDENPNPFDESTPPACDTSQPKTTEEFYRISEGNDDGSDTLFDDQPADLLDSDGNPPEELNAVYYELAAKLDEILDSEQPCGTDGNDQIWTLDGNLDGVIDQRDLDLLADFSLPGNPFSSWYDVTVDGWTLVDAETDDDGVLHGSDYQLVSAKLGTECAPE